MELLQGFLDLLLHVEPTLKQFAQDHGTWIYALLFAIIFIETGVVVMPFLPGDSLLFIVGFMCSNGTLDLGTAMGLMFAAAVAGNQCNYAIGRLIGPKVFHWEQSRWFNRRAFDQAHAFYEKWGGITIVAARFMPFARTFAPFVAGVAEMSRARFTLFDVTGGALWIGSITLAGYFFGNIEFVKHNLEKIVIAMIVVPALIAIVGSLRARRAQA